MSILSKRVPTIVGLLVLVAGVVGGVLFVNNRRLASTASSLPPQKVRITNVSDNRFTVSWVTTAPTAGYVYWGKVGEKLTNEAVDDRDSIASEGGSYNVHHVTVKDLQPNTQYAFRIASSSKKALYDNNGSPYTVSTGPILTATPPADTVYGSVQTQSGAPAEGVLVYVDIPGATPLSTLVKSSGNWTLPLSIARSADLKSYVSYDPKATILTVRVESGREQATASVATANAAPVPNMTLGQTYDFRASASLDEGEAASESGVVAEVDEGETPGIFNIDPLGSVATGAAQVNILNPSKDGENITTTLPEFRGTGEEGMVLEITVESETQYRDTVAVEDDGTWTWTPPDDLEPGEHTITIAYLDEEGIRRTIKRSFTVQASSGLPSFQATPSASVKPSSTPSASPRVTIPSTQSGVPVSGILGPTVLTALVGFVIMIAGALLLVL